MFEGMGGKDTDIRLSIKEYQQGCAELGMDMSDAQAKDIFKVLHVGSKMLFDQFCTWYATMECPVQGEQGQQEARTSKMIVTSNQSQQLQQRQSKVSQATLHNDLTAPARESISKTPILGASTSAVQGALLPKVLKTYL